MGNTDCEKLLTVQETACYLKVSEQTVRKLLLDDLLPYIRIGRQYRIVQNSLFLSLQKAYEIKDAKN
jgi:excisionase family DNA binding protein